MANLSIKDFPDDLLREARMEAFASGGTFRAWMIDLMEQVCGQEQNEQKAGRLGDAGGLPKRPRRFTGQRSARFAGQEQASAPLDAIASTVPEELSAPGRATREKIEPCSHGLLFHPGCND